MLSSAIRKRPTKAMRFVFFGLFLLLSLPVGGLPSFAANDGNARTNKSPSMPMGISFSSNTQGRGSEISVSWFPSGGASSYTLQIAGDDSYRDAETLYEGTEANFSEVLGDGEYYFRVRANNDSGSSNWLPLGPVSVCVKPNPPQNISYPQESNGGNYSVDWSSVGRAESYTLERASGMSFVDAIPVYQGVDTHYDESDLGKGTYYYRVRSEISCGYSLWKTGKAIVVSGPPGFVTNVNSLNISEGRTATFSVKLSAEPDTSVTAAVERVSGDEDVSIVEGSVLTFTGMNWNRYQTVTLSLADDPDTESGESTIRIHSEGMPSNDVVVNEIENDFILQVESIGSGAGTVVSDPSGILCGADCEIVLSKGNRVTLTAEPDERSVFGGWVGSACSGTEDCSFTIDSNTRIQAVFDLKTFVVTTKENAGGRISPKGPIVVDYAKDLTASIIPDAHYHISDVLVDGVSVGPVTDYSFTGAKENHTIEAFFEIDSHTLSMNRTGEGQGIVSPAVGDHSFSYGTEVPISAQPTENSVFDGWSGDVSGKGDLVVLMDSDKRITGSFSIKTFTVTPKTNPGGTISPFEEMTVKYGGTSSFELTPDEGRVIADVIVDGTSVGAVSSYTFSDVTSDHTIEAVFEKGQHVISVQPSENGSISPSGNVSVKHGNDAVFNIEPDPHYHVEDVLVDGVTVGAVDRYTFENVTDEHTISATFALNTYTLTVSAAGNGNGTVSPSTGTHTFNYGDVVEFSATPSDDSIFRGWSGDISVSESSATITMDGDKQVTATFALKTYSILPKANIGGTIDPAELTTVNHGDELPFGINPDEGYVIKDVIVDGTSVGAVSSYTFSGVTADHTIEAVFEKGQYVIAVQPGENGSISPSGNVSVKHGDDAVFTIEPDPHYHIQDVLVDGATVGPVQSYTFENVTGEHTISASFAINTYTLTVSTAGDGNGTVSPSAGTHTYNYGDIVELNAAPSDDSVFQGWSGDISESAPATSITMDGDKQVTASFGLKTFTITPKAGKGGTVDPAQPVSVTYGGETDITIHPDEGYVVQDVIVDGSSVGAVTFYTLSGVISDHTVEAVFEKGQYVIAVQPGENGSISPSGNVSVKHGDDAVFTIEPDPHYHIQDVLVDGATVGPVQSYTFENVTYGHTISATFAVDTHTLTVSTAGNGNGTISPSAGTHTYSFGDVVELSATPSDDSIFQGWSGDISESAPVATITMDGDKQVTATFGLKAFTITPKAGKGGSIDPDQPVSISYGGETNITIHPDEGYVVQDVIVDGSSVGAVTFYTLSGVISDHTVEAVFEKGQYVIAVQPGENGSISPSGNVSVKHGDDAIFTIEPDPHYHIQDVLVDGASVGTVSQYTFENVTSGHSISATFAIDTHTLTVSTAGNGNGTVSPSAATYTYNFGDVVELSATPSDDSIFQGWSGDISESAPVATITMDGDKQVTATFGLKIFTITPKAGKGGSIDPAQPVSVTYGGDSTFTINPNEGYVIQDVIVDGSSVGPVSSYTFSGVTSDHVIEADFEKGRYVITVQPGENGSISTSGNVSVKHGDDAVFTIEPDSHYHIQDVLVDGASIGPVSSYTFENVTSGHTISASFAVDTHTITISTAGNGNGTVSPSAATYTYNFGDVVELSAVPSDDSIFRGWSGDISASAPSATITMDGDKQVTATFGLKTFTITPKAGTGGTVDPAQPVSVIYGGDSTFTINPNEGYVIQDVIVDGSSVGAVSSYTFSGVIRRITPSKPSSKKGNT